MNRRTVGAWLASLLAAGCGGGGGGGSIESTSTSSPPGPSLSPSPSSSAGVATVSADPVPSAVPSFSGNPGIALWGDSMIPGVARAFSYTFVPPRQIFDAGIAGQTSVQIAARQLADTDHRDWVTIFWYGHNNVTQPDQIKADLAASVAHLAPGNHRFIVLSVLNQGNGQQGRGSPTYESIMRLNNDLAATYGANYLDIRGFMVNQSDPNDPQQAAEFQQDLPSSSLRFDAIHLTGFGSEVVGRRLMAFIEAKNW